ncbi:hypothetical protein M23134_04337 [Microscilla marina ATCC 23134]|uniref:Uncharacterized protein n=1 Tax=Microscilla marina ATCC 23134 TaxID=313606 RepID=A1ZLV9_MICM2|nr:hypothetical protein M23134_04337 [Microscilla marina ATCC 23134]
MIVLLVFSDFFINLIADKMKKRIQKYTDWFKNEKNLSNSVRKFSECG